MSKYKYGSLPSNLKFVFRYTRQHVHGVPPIFARPTAAMRGHSSMDFYAAVRKKKRGLGNMNYVANEAVNGV